jgi:exopolysaccharide production protein ExoQ
MIFTKPTIAALIGLPPTIALLATVAFIFFLFRRDFREKPNVTSALWLPFIWFVLIGSRSPTQWLSLSGLVSLGSFEEGNPFDALIYFILIVAAFCVLSQRGADLGEFIRNNSWLTVFLLYCFIAVFWSDFPLSAFKRWIKVLGHPLMVLVLFTEPDFYEAVATLIKRAAYILVPFSIVLIKYYPGIGRGFDEWGAVNNRGVALDKNGLAAGCMIFGLFFLWHWLRTWHGPRGPVRSREIRLIMIFALMIGWLIWHAHSATSFLSLAIGAVVMLLVGQQWVNNKLIGSYIILAVIALVVGDLTFGIFERMVALTGHSTTLLGRGALWRELLALDTNPIFGVGFESFWLGDRLQRLWEAHWWKPTEAHNGYLETYLNLGLIGLFLLIALLIATFRKVRTELLVNLEWGRMRFAVLIAIIFNNWTEAKFRGLSIVWFAFYIIAIEYPTQMVAVDRPVHNLESDDSEELAYTETRN